MSAPFIDRADAGRRLAERLAREQLPSPIVVLALPRGGVPIGAEVARRLGAPLDLLLVRKIGAPWQRELAVAAVVEGDGPEVVIDDGIATGTTVRAALQALRRRAPARLVLAVPVAPRDTLARLAGEVDLLVCLATPEPFHAVGLHYRDFHQVEDDEVIAALDAARPPPSRAT